MCLSEVRTIADAGTKVDEAQRAATSLRNRVSGPIPWVGWTLYVLGVTPMLVLAFVGAAFRAGRREGAPIICRGFSWGGPRSLRRYEFDRGFRMPLIL